MCGIVGFVSDQDKSTLRRMNRKLIHRGPDDEGYYHKEGVGLAMRRLSIIDVKGGHQPIANRDETIWTVFNGEIYNFIELREDLEKKGYVFRTDHSDTEVIVHAYEEYGPKFVERLNGMFAIAIWDSRNRKLLVYRDRTGEKPLYYWIKGKQFFFASEMKSLITLPFFKRKVNESALFYYMSLKNAPRDHCFFEGIEALGPGEMLVFENGKCRRKAYWKIDTSTELKISETEAISEIRYLLKDSIKYRMISDVPLGAYLSGGLDSSAVVGIMSRLRKKPVETFSLMYRDAPQGKEDDRVSAFKMSKRFNTKHREYCMDLSEFTEHFDDIIEAFDEPFGGTISTFFLSKLIRKHVKVAVSGDGADEMFGSYRVHRLAQPLYHFNEYMKKGISPDRLSSSQLSKLAPFDQDMDTLKSLNSEHPYQWHAKLGVFSDQEKKQAFSKRLLQHTSGLSMLKYYKKAYSQTQTNDPLNKVLQVECQNLLPDQILSFVDRLSMAHSVEVRPPFLDHRLVEFAFKLPGAMKINKGITKYILKRAAENVLPRSVIHRPKEGFILPYHYWMQTYLQDKIKYYLSPKLLKKHGFFNSDYVKSLVENYDKMGLQGSNKVLLLLMFQMWWKKYFD